jgi:acyl-CoA reductase-like NAD-dependent aldehyde dehydrogenase
VNTTVPVNPGIPMGGLKASGIGREGGLAGLREYQELVTTTLG